MIQTHLLKSLTRSVLKENEMIQLDAGDIIKMKKKHPCGSDEWQIVKTGADVKLRCCGCSHEIILKRSLVEKNTKKIKKKENKDL